VSARDLVYLIEKDRGLLRIQVTWSGLCHKHSSIIYPADGIAEASSLSHSLILFGLNSFIPWLTRDVLKNNGKPVLLETSHITALGDLKN
jgi:hypothetical protein